MPESNQQAPTGRCILCLKPDAILTEEHVFPDAVGGGLCRYILCKICNEKLGQRVDGPYSQEKHVQLARNVLKIGGRRNNVPQPFDSIFDVDGGKHPLRIKLSTDFEPEVITAAPKIERAGEGITLSVVVDTTKRETLPGIIRSKLKRYFKSAEGMALGWRAEEVEKAIAQTCEMALQVESTETPISTMLSGRWTVNLKVLFVEHLKVAYELAAIELGDDFVGSARAEPIRQFLLSQVADGGPAEWDFSTVPTQLQVIPQLPEMMVERVIRPVIDNGEIHRFHVASVSPRAVIVSMMGMGVILVNPALKSTAAPVIYRNNMATQICHIERGKFVTARIETTKG